MRCSTARKLINDYLDHSLEGKKVSSLEHHLQQCPDCQALLKDFERIIENAHSLESLAPSPETWLKIKAELKPEERAVEAQETSKLSWLRNPLSPPKLKYVLASTFILLIFIVTMITIGPKYWWVKHPEDPHRYALAKLEEAEHHYQLAIKALEAAAASEKDTLEPQLIQVFKGNLEVVDATIKACKQAVIQDPDNLEVRNYLLEAYRKKMDVLDRMIALKPKASPSIRRNPSL